MYQLTFISSFLRIWRYMANTSFWSKYGLVMAVHNSPLAEPKNIFLGHTLSALSGVLIFALMGSSFISLGIAVGLAVLLWQLLIQFIRRLVQIQLLQFLVVGIILCFNARCLRSCCYNLICTVLQQIARPRLPLISL